MIKLDKLEKLGWDSLSFRAYIVRPELEYVTEDVETHIEGMDLDSQYITDFFINIYVTNLDEDEKMQIGSVKGRFFLPMDFTRFGITLNDVADCRGWDFGAMASAIIGKDGNIKPEAQDMVMNDLKNHFRPEFLNRLDETIMFKPLTKANITNIIDLLVKDLNRRLADKELSVELTPAAKNYVADHGYEPMYGARPLKRYLQKSVETLAARLILSDGVDAEDTILIDVENDQLIARVK